MHKNRNLLLTTVILFTTALSSIAQETPVSIHADVLDVETVEVAPVSPELAKGRAGAAVLQTGNQSFSAIVPQSSVSDLSDARLRLDERHRTTESNWVHGKNEIELTAACQDLSSALPRDTLERGVTIEAKQLELLGPADPLSAIARPDDRLAALVTFRYYSEDKTGKTLQALSAVLLFRRDLELLSCGLLVPGAGDEPAPPNWSRFIATEFALTGITATQGVAATAPERRRPFLAVAFKLVSESELPFEQPCDFRGCDPTATGYMAFWDLVAKDSITSAKLASAHVDKAFLDEVQTPANFVPTFEFAVPVTGHKLPEVLTGVNAHNRYDYRTPPPTPTYTPLPTNTPAPTSTPTPIPPNPCAEPTPCKPCEDPTKSPFKPTQFGWEDTGTVEKRKCDCEPWKPPAFCQPTLPPGGGDPGGGDPGTGGGGEPPPKETPPPPVKPTETPRPLPTSTPTQKPRPTLSPTPSPTATKIPFVFGAVVPLYLPSLAMAPAGSRFDEAARVEEKLEKVWLQSVIIEPGTPAVWVLLQNRPGVGSRTDAGIKVTVRTLSLSEATRTENNPRHRVLFDSGSFSYALTQVAPLGVTPPPGAPITTTSVNLFEGRAVRTGEFGHTDNIFGVIDTGRILVAPDAGKNKLVSRAFTEAKSPLCPEPFAGSIAAIPESPWFPGPFPGGIRAPFMTIGWSCSASTRGAEWLLFKNTSGTVSFDRYCRQFKNIPFNALVVTGSRDRAFVMSPIAQSVIQVPELAMNGRTPELQFTEVSPQPNSNPLGVNVNWVTYTSEFVQCGRSGPLPRD